MTIWIFLIVIVSVVGGLIIEYQKNKMQMMGKSQQNEEEVEELRKLVNSMKGRIENLEAIAAGSPDDFSTGAGKGMAEIEIEDEPSIKEENKQQVSDIADKRRTR
ncbi:hypothetical protein [Fodinibius salsisoli]|uniref:Phage shock protein B n=1 Tax=Fodinibius salsisoli TaxID=2820877 RepID=A0ABT3PLW7_9BACT|nr:hypothetical protein [Fodinibius salsisoli]MCW9706907.1 hypothetical protein [Fodinibius salsisoli]